MKPEEPPARDERRVVDDQLAHELDDLLGAFVQSHEAVAEFAPRGVVWILAECARKGRAIEQQTALRHKQADSKAMDNLLSALHQ